MASGNQASLCTFKGEADPHPHQSLSETSAKDFYFPCITTFLTTGPSFQRIDLKTFVPRFPHSLQCVPGTFTDVLPADSAFSCCPLGEGMVALLQMSPVDSWTSAGPAASPPWPDLSSRLCGTLFQSVLSTPSNSCFLTLSLHIPCQDIQDQPIHLPSLLLHRSHETRRKK